ncbi:hypothetical protein M0802_013413 [Mischocyttarus mexicanus]|nr:hypothetical protein M0802_013413 [Mischocyttarus mexicanus]
MAKNLDHGTFLPNKLINNGNRYKIQTGDITEKDQPSKETKQYPNLANTERRKIKIDNRDLRMDSEMDTDSEDVQEWIPAKSTKLKDFKKRKISEVNNNNNISSAPTPTKWLQEIPISNSFNLLEDSAEIQNNTEKQEETKSVKPPPIYIEAEVIDPLLELLDETAGRNNYIIKQLKDNQVKVQTSTPDTFRKVVSALKNKNAGYHTYQEKSEKSYKIVIRGLHPKSNTVKIINVLDKLGHKVRSINNITKFDTKQPLPLFFIELAPQDNNKNIYEINNLLNTIIKIEPPKTKRDIPQCTRCQAYGHTKNYCNRNPACVKCAQKHLTTHCPQVGRIEKVICVNCNGNHPANYKGCQTRKLLQQKLFPTLRKKVLENPILDEAYKDNHYNKQNVNANTDYIPVFEHNKPIRSYADVTKQTYSKLNCNIPLKTPLQIEKAVNNLTDAIQEAAWASTPQNFLPKKILTIYSDSESSEELSQDQDEQSDSEESLSNFCEVSVDHDRQYNPRPVFSETIGPKHMPPNISQLIEYFNLFFTPEFLKMLKTETNRYARQFLEHPRVLKSSRVLVWKKTTIPELRAFIAVLLEMGITRRLTLFSYWSRNYIIDTFRGLAKCLVETDFSYFASSFTSLTTAPKGPGTAINMTQQQNFNPWFPTQIGSSNFIMHQTNI